MLVRMWSNRSTHSQAQPHWKSVWWFLTKLNTLLPYDSEIMFLDIYLNNLKTYVQTKTGTQMFIAALFITAKSWKQPRCPSVGEQVNKVWSRQIMKYYSTLQK